MRTIPDALPSSAKPPRGKWARLRRRLIPGSRWSVTDPAEAGEIPVSSRDRFKIAGRPPGPPFRPSRPDDVPPSARSALEVHCGPLPLERLFVVPKTTRLGALDYPTVRPNLREPVLIAVGDVAGIRRGRTGPPSGVAVLGSRELVIANEPSDSLDFARYGIDLLAVPRERLDSLSWDGRSLTVHLASDCVGVEGHSSVVLPLDPGLVEAMGRAFGSAVQWI